MANDDLFPDDLVPLYEKDLGDYQLEWALDPGDNEWRVRTVHEDGTATPWGKSDAPPADAQDIVPTASTDGEVTGDDAGEDDEDEELDDGADHSSENAEDDDDEDPPADDDEPEDGPPAAATHED